MTTASGITVIAASAGSGKTYRLTAEVTDALTASDPRIDVTSIVAVTFTRKAHSELEARIRQKLVGIGAFEDALRLPLTYVGTVHAVSLRLLQEFAIDAGLSPTLDVVAGNETKLLREAFERTLDEPTRRRLDELAARLELRLDGRARRTDWVTPCADIMDLARSNRITPSALPGMAERSLERLFALLPPAVRDGHALDEALAHELEITGRRLEQDTDGKGVTTSALDLIKVSRRKLADNELRWSGWAKLAGISPSQRCEGLVSDLRLVAARYEEHPRFHDDLRSMTRAIFDAARAGLVAYQDWKRERYVVDYVDMLDGALTLLDNPRTRSELASRLRLIVVDEFQDTSPIQLALFMRLHAIIHRSIWVGDRKQCIFEYAGADPLLMDAVSDWVARHGGRLDRLEHNYRSRPELVTACSELFALGLARHGFTREEVTASPRRAVPESASSLPPVGLWCLEGRNKRDDASAIAEGIQRLLGAPHETPIVDRVTGCVRGVRPGDIAVLATTNEWAAELARALHARSIRAATARAGLLDTPEGALTDAALRWLLDEHDELAAANIDALTGWRGGSPDEWLANRLRHVSSGGTHGSTDEQLADWRGALRPLRERLAWVSPAEALDLILEALDLIWLCARWPDSPQRVANLDALRGVAANYEARCAQEREAATVAGLVRYFDDVRSPMLQRDEMLPSDDQHVPTDDGAVVVCTYHKSKGLEWPVVILANLDRPERRDAFEVSPESDESAFDPENPLAHRRIRYWPWPFGATERAPLRDRAEQSPEGQAVAQREERERARLLYVGFTRPRDHLVLAVRTTKQKAATAWLDVLGEDALDLPIQSLDRSLAETRMGSTGIATRVWRLGAEAARPTPDATAPRWFVRASDWQDVRPPYRINPSAIAETETEPTGAVVGTIERFERGIPLRGRPVAYDAIGQAIHAFLAADVEGLSTAERMERAERLLRGWLVSDFIAAEDVLRAGDVLRSWVDRRFGAAMWHREMPVEGPAASLHGERWVSGIVDLLVETSDGFVLIDHKTFPAPNESAWRTKCATFIPQLATYERLITTTQSKPVVEGWIHLPLGGGMVNIRFGIESAPLSPPRHRRQSGTWKT